jgi:hypothetical protein
MINKVPLKFLDLVSTLSWRSMKRQCNSMSMTDISAGC